METPGVKRPKPPGGVRNWWGRRSRFTKWALAILVLVFVVIPGCSAIFSGSGDDDKAAQPPPPPPAETAPPPPPPPPAETKPKGPPGGNIRARSTKFVQAMRFCQRSVSVLRNAIVQGAAGSLIELADATRTSKEICDRTQDQLRELDTEHFDDQAITAQIAVDSWKDGLDALADYIDEQTPSKILEARDKLNEGDATAEQAVDEINGRRAKFGVKPLS